VEHGFPLYKDISVMSTTHAYSVITCRGMGDRNGEASRWRRFLSSSSFSFVKFSTMTKEYLPSPKVSTYKATVLLL
jgi:hypothetical protein